MYGTIIRDIIPGNLWDEINQHWVSDISSIITHKEDTNTLSLLANLKDFVSKQQFTYSAFEDIISDLVSCDE